MVTVPAHSFCDPTRWCVIAAARFMPGVCGVFVSSAWAGMTTTPCVRQSGWLPGSVVIVVEDRRPPAICELAVGWAHHASGSLLVPRPAPGKPPGVVSPVPARPTPRRPGVGADPQEQQWSARTQEVDAAEGQPGTTTLAPGRNLISSTAVGSINQYSGRNPDVRMTAPAS